ncbi:MAG: hypothetical protein ACKOBN_04435, partial [Flavobacteriales bacterium]
NEEEVLSNQEKNIKNEEISNQEEAINNEVISNQEEGFKNEVASKEEIVSNENPIKKEVISNEEEVLSNQEKNIKNEEISNQEEGFKNEVTSNKEIVSNENPIKNERTSNEEEVISNREEAINNEVLSNQQKNIKNEEISNQEEGFKNEVVSNKEIVSNENPIKKEVISNEEEVISNREVAINNEVLSNQEKNIKNEEISNQEEGINNEVISNQEEGFKKEVSSNKEIVSNENPIKKEVISNEEEVLSNQEEAIINEVITNQEEGFKNQVASNREERILKEELSNQEKLNAIERAATQLKEDQTEFETIDIPTFALQKESLEALDLALALPAAKIQSEAELASELWQPYMLYLEQRDSMEQLKEQIAVLNKEIESIELTILEAPSEASGQQLLLKVQQQQVAITALKNEHAKLIAQEKQAQFEALFELGYLPPYELIASSASNPSSISSTIPSTSSESTNTSSAITNLPFEINKQPNLTVIPIGLPCPQGLVFRVQVGAFRKPIPAGKFSEFSPVDGRILANGLTVVMAGYFRSSAEALKQRNIIRTMGYADAFIVAYNGCERLSYANGVQLEAVQQPNMKAAAQRTVFEAPGEGLYYTVQVGVYNRPLLSEKQLGLPELIEAKTAKGQYRYASGRFDQLKAAKERQRLAVTKGITDAFIVAYYQGKRISLAEAKQLTQQGIVMDTKPTKLIEPTQQAPKLTLEKVPVLPVKKQLKAQDQFVRYELNCTDCTDQLARLNKMGVCTYILATGKISTAQFNENELTTQQRYNFKKLNRQTSNMKGPFTTITTNEQQINGAQMDWLLRQGAPYLLQIKDGNSIISVEIK